MYERAKIGSGTQYRLQDPKRPKNKLKNVLESWAQQQKKEKGIIPKLDKKSLFELAHLLAPQLGYLPEPASFIVAYNRIKKASEQQ